MSRREAEGYAHTASAYALAGFLTSPAPESIETQGASVLSASGGYGSSRVERYRFREVVSFDEASVQVAGSSGDKHFSTVAEVTIKGLDVLGMVTADAVVARLAAVHYGSPTEVAKIRVTTAGSHFVNLRIKGELVDPQIDECRELGEALSLGRPAAKQSSETANVEAIREEDRRRTLSRDTAHNGVYIPQFGAVHIAEWLPDPYAPTLTMLRIELGCAFEGSTTMASVQGGGRGWP